MANKFEDFMIEASASFLTERFPTGYHEWGYEKLEEYIDDHAWSVLEGWDAGSVYCIIEAVAEGFWGLHKEEK